MGRTLEYQLGGSFSSLEEMMMAPIKAVLIKVDHIGKIMLGEVFIRHRFMKGKKTTWKKIMP